MTLSALIDTFKESVAQANLLMELTAEYCVVCLSIALLCSLIVMLVYRFFYRGPCFSANFSILLCMTALVTTTIILTISANLVLSLGMVGALSIVRFRAAIKDPLDVGFLFWSVAVGITCGAGLYLFALTGSLFIAVIYIALQLLRGRVRTYLLIVRFDNAAFDAVQTELQAARAHVRSRSQADGKTELTASLFLWKNNRDIDRRISALDKVESAVLLEFTGDV